MFCFLHCLGHVQSPEVWNAYFKTTPIGLPKGGSKTPLRNSAARQLRVLAKVSNITYRKSTTLLPTTYTHEASTFLLYISPQKGGSKIPLRNFANRSSSCVARSLCDSWATCWSSGGQLSIVIFLWIFWCLCLIFGLHKFSSWTARIMDCAKLFGLHVKA